VKTAEGKEERDTTLASALWQNLRSSTGCRCRW